MNGIIIVIKKDLWEAKGFKLKGTKRASITRMKAILTRRKLLFRLAAFARFFLFILHLCYVLGDQQMSAMPISMGFF